ncbi:Uncharacterised protein [Campylobacter hyointestinalis subsp. hyointestinalis]|nr:Uncharacterised protein [Campylobacter hyointestinalis subsp. hyointestinalis]CUU88959.1 Uncharacterised protein [Campylobacter hyointestinalis subsp. hyointestinalis]
MQTLNLVLELITALIKLWAIYLLIKQIKR